jgi:hypothetical protein
MLSCGSAFRADGFSEGFKVNIIDDDLACRISLTAHTESLVHFRKYHCKEKR